MGEKHAMSPSYTPARPGFSLFTLYKQQPGQPGLAGNVSDNQQPDQPCLAGNVNELSPGPAR